MKQFSFFKTLLIAAVMLLGSGSVYSQVNISAGNTITQDFDGIGTSTTATLPAGWKVSKNNTERFVGSYSSAGTATEQIAGNGMSSSATNGIYNFGAGVAGSAIDRAIGGISSGSASKSVNVYVDLYNNGASAINDFTISYNVEKYRNGTNTAGFSIQMYYSTDGSTWTSAGNDFLTSFAGGDANSNGFTSAPGATLSVSGKTLNVSLAANSHLYLAWNYSVTTGSTTSNAQALGIDDVSITANGEVSPTITVSPAELSDFTYIHGNGPSAAQPFTVSGSNLTANISLTAPTNYEISTLAGSGYGGSLTLTQSGGNVGSTTIYVRLKAGLAVGNYNGETVNITSSGTTAKTVTLNGSVTAPPPPDAPVATAATAVGSTGFTANWNAVSGITEYRLDVYRGESLINEDFSSITTGDNTTTGGSNSSWAGNTNFPTVSTAYQAGGVVRIGKSDGTGSITSKEIDLSNGAVLTFDVKGWTTVEGDIKITVDNGTAQTVTYTATMSGNFETKTVTLAPATASSKVKIETSAKRAFIDNVVISNKQFVSGYENLSVDGTSKNITGLTASTTYYYTVKATSPWGVSATSNEISVTTLAASPVSTFTGSGDWHLASNWSTNSVPNFTTDVVIDGNVTVTQNYAECKNMTINPGGALTVVNIDNVRKQLVINGNLLIKSDASGTGSVIFNSDNESQNSFTNIHILGTSTATIQRYISAADWEVAGSGWHLISSPVSVELIEGKWTPTGNDNDYDFYALDESKENEYWLNQKVSANGIYSFEPGIGYLVAYQQSDTKEFNATDIIQGYKVLSINTSDVTISDLANTTGSAYPGWHLLGNPFSSALKYDNTWTKSNIDAIIQVWDSQEGSYKTSADVNGIIPAMNGFMVHSSGNGSITIPASKRVHNSTNWYKSGEDYILLVARDLDGTTSQSSIVRFNPAATTGYDSQFDSYFLAGFAPMFYSVSGDDLYALNTLPEQSSGLVVPFGFIKNNSTNFSIGLEKSLPGSVLFLTDNKTGETVNLTEGGSYQFTSEEGDDANRFALHFAPLGIEKPGAALDAKIYAYQQVVYLAGLDTGAEVTITDLMGRTVKRVQLNGGGLSTINAAGLPKGAYIVTAVSASGSVSAKVIL